MDGWNMNPNAPKETSMGRYVGVRDLVRQGQFQALLRALEEAEADLDASEAERDRLEEELDAARNFIRG